MTPTAQPPRPDFDTLAAALPDGILVTGDDEVLYANPTMAAFLGFASAVELTGRAPASLLDEPDREPFARFGRGPRRGPEETPLREWRFLRQDGTGVALEAVVGRGVRFDGQDACLWAFRNTGDRQQLQVQLMQADRMASVGTLAAGVAHEINNPLAYVLANLEYVASELPGLGVDTADARVGELLQALQEAREGAERVRHIVRDLKTFSRPNEEQSGPVDLRRVIEASINMVFNEIKHRARLVKDYGATPPVEANESRLGQVFLNLLLNAAQAIPDGATDRHRIRIVTGTDSQGRVVAEVHDSGGGMSAEVMAHIFDPFFTTKPIGVGTGLGLPICRSIVTTLGGTLEVESEVGSGSMFRVVLPPATLQPGRERPAEPPVVAGRRGRILVIDDEPMVLAAVRRAMTPEHEVVTEANASAALHRLRAGDRFDLIICDLMMPQVSGMDLYEELQATAPDLLDRLVFLTGGAFTARAREFLDRVPSPRMEKPFEGPQLLALVRSLLG